MSLLASCRFTAPLRLYLRGLRAGTFLATPDQANVEFFNREAGYFRQHRRMQFGNRDIFESAAHTANQMLMRIDVRIEASN